MTNGFANTISTPSSFTQASLLAQRRKIVGKGNTYFFRMDASTEMILGRQFFCRQQYKTMTHTDSGGEISSGNLKIVKI